MSGGVDSSVAAALLKEQGYDLIGVTLQIWPEGVESGGQGCCSIDAVEDARRVANRLAIPHYVMNMREDFENTVIRDFVDEYARGRTPNPCIRCNEKVKFRALLRRARALGAGWLATGHYARIERCSSGQYLLKRAASLDKDQSYVLYMMGQEELACTMFPLGPLDKDDTRAMARDLGLQVWSKPDSQEICFVGKDSYREFIAERRPDLAREGAIVDLQGRRIGTHQGTIGYTIGQRRGMRVAAPEPLYVVDIDARANSVTVGPESALMAESVTVGQVSWVSGNPPDGFLAVACKVRYNMASVPAALSPLEEGAWRLAFSTPQRAPTPGQAAVFYGSGNAGAESGEDDVVLGGGTIEAIHRSADAGD